MLCHGKDNLLPPAASSSPSAAPLPDELEQLSVCRDVDDGSGRSISWPPTVGSKESKSNSGSPYPSSSGHADGSPRSRTSLSVAPPPGRETVCPSDVNRSCRAKGRTETEGSGVVALEHSPASCPMQASSGSASQNDSRGDTRSQQRVSDCPGRVHTVPGESRFVPLEGSEGTSLAFDENEGSCVSVSISLSVLSSPRGLLSARWDSTMSCGNDAGSRVAACFYNYNSSTNAAHSPVVGSSRGSFSSTPGRGPRHSPSLAQQRVEGSPLSHTVPSSSPIKRGTSASFLVGSGAAGVYVLSPLSTPSTSPRPPFFSPVAPHHVSCQEKRSRSAVLPSGTPSEGSRSSSTRMVSSEDPSKSKISPFGRRRGRKNKKPGRGRGGGIALRQHVDEEVEEALWRFRGGSPGASPTTTPSTTAYTVTPATATGSSPSHTGSPTADLSSTTSSEPRQRHGGRGGDGPAVTADRSFFFSTTGSALAQTMAGGMALDLEREERLRHSPPHRGRHTLTPQEQPTSTAGHHKEAESRAVPNGAAALLNPISADRFGVDGCNLTPPPAPRELETEQGAGWRHSVETSPTTRLKSLRPPSLHSGSAPHSGDDVGEDDSVFFLSPLSISTVHVSRSNIWPASSPHNGEMPSRPLVPPMPIRHRPPTVPIPPQHQQRPRGTRDSGFLMWSEVAGSSISHHYLRDGESEMLGSTDSSLLLTSPSATTRGGKRTQHHHRRSGKPKGDGRKSRPKQKCKADEADNRKSESGRRSHRHHHHRNCHCQCHGSKQRSQHRRRGPSDGVGVAANVAAEQATFPKERLFDDVVSSIRAADLATARQTEASRESEGIPQSQRKRKQRPSIEKPAKEKSDRKEERKTRKPLQKPKHRNQNDAVNIPRGRLKTRSGSAPTMPSSAAVARANPSAVPFFFLLPMDQESLPEVVAVPNTARADRGAPADHRVDGVCTLTPPPLWRLSSPFTVMHTPRTRYTSGSGSSTDVGAHGAGVGTPGLINRTMQSLVASTNSRGSSVCSSTLSCTTSPGMIPLLQVPSISPCLSETLSGTRNTVDTFGRGSSDVVEPSPCSRDSHAAVAPAHASALPHTSGVPGQLWLNYAEQLDALRKEEENRSEPALHPTVNPQEEEEEDWQSSEIELESGRGFSSPFWSGQRARSRRSGESSSGLGSTPTPRLHLHQRLAADPPPLSEVSSMLPEVTAHATAAASKNSLGGRAAAADTPVPIKTEETEMKSDQELTPEPTHAPGAGSEEEKRVRMILQAMELEEQQQKQQQCSPRGDGPTYSTSSSYVSSSRSGREGSTCSCSCFCSCSSSASSEWSCNGRESTSSSSPLDSVSSLESDQPSQHRPYSRGTIRESKVHKPNGVAADVQRLEAKFAELSMINELLLQSSIATKDKTLHVAPLKRELRHPSLYTTVERHHRPQAVALPSSTSSPVCASPRNPSEGELQPYTFTRPLPSQGGISTVTTESGSCGSIWIPPLSLPEHGSAAGRRLVDEAEMNGGGAGVAASVSTIEDHSARTDARCSRGPTPTLDRYFATHHTRDNSTLSFSSFSSQAMMLGASPLSMGGGGMADFRSTSPIAPSLQELLIYKQRQQLLHGKAYAEANNALKLPSEPRKSGRDINNRRTYPPPPLSTEALMALTKQHELEKAAESEVVSGGAALSWSSTKMLPHQSPEQRGGDPDSDDRSDTPLRTADTVPMVEPCRETPLPSRHRHCRRCCHPSRCRPASQSRGGENEEPRVPERHSPELATATARPSSPCFLHLQPETDVVEAGGGDPSRASTPTPNSVPRGAAQSWNATPSLAEPPPQCPSAALHTPSTTKTPLPGPQTMEAKQLHPTLSHTSSPAIRVTARKRAAGSRTSGALSEKSGDHLPPSGQDCTAPSPSSPRKAEGNALRHADDGDVPPTSVSSRSSTAAVVDKPHSTSEEEGRRAAETEQREREAVSLSLRALTADAPPMGSPPPSTCSSVSLGCHTFNVEDETPVTQRLNAMAAPQTRGGVSGSPQHPRGFQHTSTVTLLCKPSQTLHRTAMNSTSPGQLQHGEGVVSSHPRQSHSCTAPSHTTEFTSSSTFLDAPLTAAASPSSRRRTTTIAVTPHGTTRTTTTTMRSQSIPDAPSSPLLVMRGRHTLGKSVLLSCGVETTTTTTPAATPCMSATPSLSGSLAFLHGRSLSQSIPCFGGQTPPRPSAALTHTTAMTGVAGRTSLARWAAEVAVAGQREEPRRIRRCGRRGGGRGISAHGTASSRAKASSGSRPAVAKRTETTEPVPHVIRGVAALNGSQSSSSLSSHAPTPESERPTVSFTIPSQCPVSLGAELRRTTGRHQLLTPREATRQRLQHRKKEMKRREKTPQSEMEKL